MRSIAYINSGSIGINITHSFRDGNAVSLQLIGVGALLLSRCPRYHSDRIGNDIIPSLLDS
ncbi:hypothetical protein [Microcoleus sp. BROC3]|uniref:hypothetical protein n=1 Tax=Microcoleus sp. BROC3 TaxID=3055323 RepID=UPI002FD5DCF4